MPFPLADERPTIYWISGAVTVVTVAFMAMRLISKAMKLSAWGADDTVILVAFVRLPARLLLLQALTRIREWSSPTTLNCSSVSSPTAVDILSRNSTNVNLVVRAGLGTDIWTIHDYDIAYFLKVSDIRHPRIQNDVS